MEEKIKKIIKEMFDKGMTLDEILEKISSIAVNEDFKRYLNKKE